MTAQGIEVGNEYQIEGTTLKINYRVPIESKAVYLFRRSSNQVGSPEGVGKIQMKFCGFEEITAKGLKQSSY